MVRGKPKPEAYPLAVTFRFRSQEQKEEFLGGLSDGWGEGPVSIEWDGDLDHTTVVRVAHVHDPRTGECLGCPDDEEHREDREGHGPARRQRVQRAKDFGPGLRRMKRLLEDTRRREREVATLLKELEDL